jgi:signal recognition particle subunit SRP54
MSLLSVYFLKFLVFNAFPFFFFFSFSPAFSVAATQSPIIFIGTGEHLDDLDPFEVKSFVSRLLGMGDVKGIMKAFQEVLPMNKAPELAQRLSEGKFTLRDMHEQFGNILKMGPIGKFMEMMPGMNNILPPQLKGSEGNAKIRVMINILDSMTDEGKEKTKGFCGGWK